MYLLITSHCKSHFVIQFKAERPIKQWPNWLVLFSNSHPPKPMLSIIVNRSDSYRLIAV